MGHPGPESIAHLRVWTTVTTPPGHLAVVTETGPAASVTTAAGSIWAELARRYGPLLVLLEHTRRQAPQESEHLGLVRHRPPTASRTGPASGRPVTITRVMPGCRPGSPPTGTRSNQLAANDAGTTTRHLSPRVKHLPSRKPERPAEPTYLESRAPRNGRGRRRLAGFSSLVPSRQARETFAMWSTTWKAEASRCRAPPATSADSWSWGAKWGAIIGRQGATWSLMRRSISAILQV